MGQILHRPPPRRKRKLSGKIIPTEGPPPMPNISETLGKEMKWQTIADTVCYPPLPENIRISSIGWFKESDYEWLMNNKPPLIKRFFWAFTLWSEKFSPWQEALRDRDAKILNFEEHEKFKKELDEALEFNPLYKK